MSVILPHSYRLTPVTELVPHPNNARKHATELIDESILENGFYKPVLASSESGYILAGHGTFERAIAAGYTELPVYWLEGLTVAQELKILASDNRTSDLASYDERALAELLQSVQSETGGFAGTGYTETEVNLLIAEAGDQIMAASRVADTAAAEESEDPEEPDCPLKARPWCLVIECDSKMERNEMLDTLRAEGRRCRKSLRGEAA